MVLVTFENIGEYAVWIQINSHIQTKYRKLFLIIEKMGKTRGVHETTPELRNRMVGMYEAGLGLRDIAAAVNCSVNILIFNL